MSLVETLHAERKARLARIAARSVEAVKPAAKVQCEAPRLVPQERQEIPEPVVEAVEAEASPPVVVEPRGAVTIESVLRIVCRHFALPQTDVLSARRTAHLILPRHLIYYMSKTLTLKSLPTIGRRLGGRDHTTVLHGVRKIERRLATDPTLRELIDELTASIGGTDQTANRKVSVRLTPEQVREIRACPDEQLVDLGKRYGVTHGAIWHVRTNRTWKHVV